MDKLGEALLIIKGEAPTHPSYRDVFLMNVGLVEKEIQRLRLDIITAHGELQVLLDERDRLRAELEDALEDLEVERNSAICFEGCFENAKAELEALKAAHTWQPIETAPKDGSHVLLWRNDIQFVGYLAAAGWCSTSVRLIEPPPTHWMPLPPTDSVATTKVVSASAENSEGGAG